MIIPLKQMEDMRELRISRVVVVEGKEKRRITHDMTFEGSKERGGSGSVNATTE